MAPASGTIAGWAWCSRSSTPTALRGCPGSWPSGMCATRRWARCGWRTRSRSWSPPRGDRWPWPTTEISSTPPSSARNSRRAGGSFRGRPPARSSPISSRPRRSLDGAGLRSIQVLAPGRVAHCVFEYIYFARPDTVLAGRTVHLARRRMGRILAREHPAQADVVISVPDSGVSAAMGFAEASSIPLEVGLVKNRYIGRTFIQPDPATRDFGVRVKLNPLRDVLDGRRVVMVDDSIVRGTTSGKIVRMLRAAGATEVHVRISSPPIRYPCFYGIDTSSRGQLVAATQSVENIRELLAADSLGYLSQAGLVEALQLAPERLCMACLDGHYPTRVPLESLAARDALEPVADRPPEPALQGGRDE